MSARHFVTTVFLCSLGLHFAASANGAPIHLSETFTHPDGTLVGKVPTPGPGGVWTVHSGTGTPPLVTSGRAVLVHGSGSRQDVNAGFTTLTSANADRVTVSFDLAVTDNTKISGSNFEYFAHFSDAGSINFYSRVDVVPPSDPNSGDYSLGIATIANAAEAILPVNFTFGNTNRVTLGFDFTTGLSSVSVPSFSVNSTTSVLGNTIKAFALRQGDSGNDETVRVDNLLVTPEPASLTLVLAGLATRRRL